MDMNWQTMLHEAANASFEKDIEVRSAADNDAYSCVDLPKAKIRELSEKILHLPSMTHLSRSYTWHYNTINDPHTTTVPF